MRTRYGGEMEGYTRKIECIVDIYLFCMGFSFETCLAKHLFLSLKKRYFAENF